MLRQPVTAESCLAALPLPMPGLGVQVSVTADELAAAAHGALHTEMAWGLEGDGKEHLTEFSPSQIGSLLITSGRTTPVALAYSQADRITVEMCYAGPSRFRDGLTELRSSAGEILIFPNSGGILCGGHHSGISFSLDKKRLARTAMALWSLDITFGLEPPFVVDVGHHSRLRSPLFCLFDYIDRVLMEEAYVADGLALDDQVYRLVAIEIGKRVAGGHLSLRQRWKKGRRGGALDELIDYIGANTGAAITLTDLQERSHYSARQLQYLFREKFDCTPMQFVRRQLLSRAMERLRVPAADDTVARIARDCGYHYMSNFSADFQRQFGVKPSVVLRQARGGKHGRLPGD